MNLSEKSPRRISAELLAASFIVLFQELAFIRWLPGQVRVLAYFPNLILLSAFLGLGLGCLRCGRRSLLWLWPASLLLLTGTAFAASHVVFTQNSVSEHLYLLYFDLPKNAPVVAETRLPIIGFFILSAVSFIPLGQLVAGRLQEFQRRAISLQGYAWDLLGSLLGVILFTCVSFAQWFPLAWFSIFLLTAVIFFSEKRICVIAYLALASAILGIVARAEKAEYYSPYYALSMQPEKNESGYTILANGSFHQHPFEMRREKAVSKFEQNVREGYHLPYRHLKQPPRRALVVGAGSGNDVAVLLDEGAGHVDAVEIDPVILRLGREIHPSHPYASDRVRAVNTDARSFLNHCTEQYDLIVFGTLDSMTRLSALSNVRLDNFVYTLDCVRAARSHLAPGGGLVMYFMAGTDYVDLRQEGMLAEVFGEVPIMISKHYGLFNKVYMVGPAFAHDDGERRRNAAPALLNDVKSQVELPTDDWPFLYLHRRGISNFYLTLMAAIMITTILGVLIASPEMRSGIFQKDGVDGEMFLFGLGFLLLETRSATEMNLLWGATWLTSAVVFGSILAMILLSTLLMQWRPLPYSWSMAGLAASLLAAWAAPTHLLLQSGAVMRLGVSLLFVGTPIFFAASCFATIFRKRQAAATAFGWNLLGAVVGGLLEMLSMETGFKTLLLLALAAYLLALALRSRGENQAKINATKFAGKKS